MHKVFRASPYPLLSHIFTGRAFLSPTFGIYFVVNRLDHKIQRQHAKNGYRFAFGGAEAVIAYTVLWFASLNLGNLFIDSALIMLHQKAVLSVIIPLSKKCFGDDGRKIWSVGIPSVVLALEPRQCVLFLRSKFDSDFFAAVDYARAQLGVKNTGQYNEFYSFVRRQIGRPLEESARKLIDEKRQILAPCDNIGEILSPLVLLVVIGLENLFDVCRGSSVHHFWSILECWTDGGWEKGPEPGRAGCNIAGRGQEGESHQQPREQLGLRETGHKRETE